MVFNPFISHEILNFLRIDSEWLWLKFRIIIQFLRIKAIPKSVSEPILKTVYISFDANRLKIIPNHSISFRIRIHLVCMEFILIKSEWFSPHLHWTWFQMFFVLVRNDHGESFNLEFKLYESKQFRNLFANHFELFRTNKKTIWISFDANLLKNNSNHFKLRFIRFNNPF